MTQKQQHASFMAGTWLHDGHRAMLDATRCRLGQRGDEGGAEVVPCRQSRPFYGGMIPQAYDHSGGLSTKWRG